MSNGDNQHYHHYMEGRISYITAFKKGSVAKRLDLMGSPAEISSSSCLRRC